MCRSVTCLCWAACWLNCFVLCESLICFNAVNTESYRLDEHWRVDSMQFEFVELLNDNLLSWLCFTWQRDSRSRQVVCVCSARSVFSWIACMSSMVRFVCSMCICVWLWLYAFACNDWCEIAMLLCLQSILVGSIHNTLMYDCINLAL